MSSKVFSILLKKLGETIQNPTLVPSPEDYCCLRIDEHYDVHLQIAPISNTIVLSTYFLPLSTASHWQESMLTHNNPWEYPEGVCFYLESNASKIGLVQEIPLENIDYTLFEKIFERYLDSVDHWMEHYQLQACSN